MIITKIKNRQLQHRNWWKKFYDQAINDSIKQSDEIRKISTGQGDYTTSCLLNFPHFNKKYRLIAADLSKQNALDPDSRAVQQIIFTGKATAATNFFLSSWNLKRNNTTTFQRNNKSIVTTYKWLNTVKWVLNYQIPNWKN